MERNRDLEIATCMAKLIPVADAISKSRFLSLGEPPFRSGDRRSPLHPRFGACLCEDFEGAVFFAPAGDVWEVNFLLNTEDRDHVIEIL